MANGTFSWRTRGSRCAPLKTCFGSPRRASNAKPFRIWAVSGRRSTCFTGKVPEKVAELVELTAEAEYLRQQIAVRDVALTPEQRTRLDAALADLAEIRRLRKVRDEWMAKHAASQREISGLRRDVKRYGVEIADLTAERARLAGVA